MAVLILVEHDNQVLRAATLNTVAAASQIGGELHPGKAQAQAVRQGVGQGGFAHTADVIDQQMPPRQQAAQGLGHHRGFAQNHAVELGQHGAQRGRGVGQVGVFHRSKP
jgi:hypothetical protein